MFPRGDRTVSILRPWWDGLYEVRSRPRTVEVVMSRHLTGSSASHWVWVGPRADLEGGAGGGRAAVTVAWIVLKVIPVITSVTVKSTRSSRVVTPQSRRTFPRRPRRPDRKASLPPYCHMVLLQCCFVKKWIGRLGKPRRTLIFAIRTDFTIWKNLSQLLSFPHISR